jgi:hypothetical protein
VHDARVVEDDVEPAPGVEVLDGGLDVGFLGDIAELKGKRVSNSLVACHGYMLPYLALDLAGVGHQLLDLGDGLIQRRL